MRPRVRGRAACSECILGVEVASKKYEELETKLEFTDYARKVANAFRVRSDNQFYSDFLYTLVDELAQPREYALRV